MPIKIKSDRKNFVQKKDREQMEYLMQKPEYVPIGLNGERTDLTKLKEVQQDIRDRFGLNVMGATANKK